MILAGLLQLQPQEQVFKYLTARQTQPGHTFTIFLVEQAVKTQTTITALQPIRLAQVVLGQIFRHIMH
jgi:hypothetical protein